MFHLRRHVKTSFFQCALHLARLPVLPWPETLARYIDFTHLHHLCLMTTSPQSESAAKKDVSKLQRAIVDGLEDIKAQDIQVFDTEHLSALFERVIVASGTSNRQTKAIAASVRDKVREAGFPKPRIEGQENGEWIIVDCGAAVAHIMQPTIRQYYRLEELWGEKPVRLKLGAAKPAAPAAAKVPAKTAARRAAKAEVQAQLQAAEDGAATPARKVSARGRTAAAGPVASASKAKTASTRKPAARKTAAAPVAAPAAKAPARKAPAQSAAGSVAVAKTPATKTAVKTAASKTAASRTAAAKTPVKSAIKTVVVKPRVTAASPAKKTVGKPVGKPPAKSAGIAAKVPARKAAPATTRKPKA